MKEFDMTSEGLMSLADKMKDQGCVATRTDQAQLVLSSIRTLCASSAARVVSYDKGEDSNVDLSSIRALMRGTCGVVDDDFAEILMLVAEMSQQADIYASMAWAAGRLEKKAIPTNTTKTYFIKNQETGLLKIGRSRNPHERAKALQCGAGVNLDILLVIDEDIEHELHLRFADDRVFNEWFYHSDAIDSYIKDKLSES